MRIDAEEHLAIPDLYARTTLLDPADYDNAVHSAILERRGPPDAMNLRTFPRWTGAWVTGR